MSVPAELEPLIAECVEAYERSLRATIAYTACPTYDRELARERMDANNAHATVRDELEAAVRAHVEQG